MTAQSFTAESDQAWVTTEVHKALDLRYHLVRIYEVWHFPQTGQELFRSFIDAILKIKQEASRFRDHCHTSEQKQDCLQEILKREGLYIYI